MKFRKPECDPNSFRRFIRFLQVHGAYSADPPCALQRVFFSLDRQVGFVMELAWNLSGNFSNGYFQVCCHPLHRQANLLPGCYPSGVIRPVWRMKKEGVNQRTALLGHVSLNARRIYITPGLQDLEKEGKGRLW